MLVILVNSKGTYQTDLAFYFSTFKVNLISYKTVMNEVENQNIYNRETLTL